LTSSHPAAGNNDLANEKPPQHAAVAETAHAALMVL